MSRLQEDIVRNFRCHWKQLFLTDIAYMFFAYILLTPLVAILFHFFLAISDSEILADQDILFFFLSPVGWVCLIVVGALRLGIVALELAALMAILATTAHRNIGPFDALRFSLANAWRVIQVTARLVGLTLLTVAPFLAIAAAVYFSLLSEYDINYYLKEKPPAFLIALGIGTVIAVLLLAVLLRLLTSWFFALPLVLFENVLPCDVLRISRERANGHRRLILLYMIGWGLATMMLSSLATTVVIGLGRFFVPRAIGSLDLLTFAIGTSLLIWVVVSLIVNLLSTTIFASIHFQLYQDIGSDQSKDSLRLDATVSKVKGSGFQLTKTRVIVVAVVGTVIASVIGVFAIKSVPLEDHVQIMAHRGSSNSAPENTMAAIRQAIEDGADWVEIDVQETADGTVVVFHDSDFMKLAGVDLKIWNATMTDLKNIDIGSWFGAEFKNERVPTLGEILDQCRGKIGVNIELKYYGHDKQLEQRVVDIVESHEMVDSIVVMSLKMDAVRKMKSIRPRWKVGLLMSVSAGNLKKINADFLAVNAGFADRSFTMAAHRSGKEVYAWTVNDAATMSVMIGRGVDGLITDKPALARSVLQQRASMSAPERLLVELGGLFGIAPEMDEQ